MNSYKFPRKGSHKAQLLTRLLNGEVVRNSKAKDDLNTANPATAMSQLRNDDHWDSYIKRTTMPSTASTGQPVYIKEYSMEATTIMELKNDDPRIESFLKTNRKS